MCVFDKLSVACARSDAAAAAKLSAGLHRSESQFTDMQALTLKRKKLEEQL
jgi:hypothetical protein